MFRTLLTIVLSIFVLTVHAKVIQVLPGHNTLQPAIDQLVNGDTLVLVDGTYTYDTSITIDVSATIRSISPGIRPRVIQSQNNVTFTLSGSATVAVFQGLDFSAANATANDPGCTLSFSALELRLIDNVVKCHVQVTGSGNSVIVGNSLVGNNGQVTVSTNGHHLVAGNLIRTGNNSFHASSGDVIYIIGNRFECNSFSNQSVNAKSCTMLRLSNGPKYVVANRFIHNVNGLLAFDANDTIRAITSSGSGIRNIQNNLFEFNGGDQFFSAAGIVQAINLTGATVNEIANNLVIYKGAMPLPGNGDAAVYAEGVGRATNNMVVDYAGTAMDSNGDILEFVYNLCSGVGNLGLCTPDKNNLSTAPLFAEEMDYTLASGSPALNGGDPGLHLSDLDGSRSDIGLHGGRIGFLQYDQQRNISDKPYIYPLFDEINLSNLNAVEVKAISIARFK